MSNEKKLGFMSDSADMKSKSILIVSGSLTIILCAIQLVFYFEKINIDFVAPLIFLFLGICVTQILNVLFINNENKEDKEPCSYRNYLKDEIGILNAYPNRKGPIERKGTYLYDLLVDLNKSSNCTTTSEDDPIRMMGVALDDFFGNDGKINSRINELYKTKSAYFRILLCKTNNRGLKLRAELIKKKCPNVAVNEFGTSKLYFNIEQARKYIDEILLKNKSDNKYFKRYYYRFSPFATIIITKNVIYYTPNMVHDDSFFLPGASDTPAKLDNRESELSFRIMRKSNLGKKLVEVFDTFWLLKDKVDENKIYDNNT